MLTRRRFMQGSALAAVMPAAFPNITFANAPGDHRLVILILRGGMDGLDVLQPYSDANFKLMRPKLAGKLGSDIFDVDGEFGLHHSLKNLMPLFNSGELAFVPAVSTPYTRRSHFDGQDILEAGTDGTSPIRDGWLNRLLEFLPGSTERYAVDVSKKRSMILRGDQPVMRWHPQSDLDLNEIGEAFLEQLYAEDNLFRKAFAGAVRAEMEDIDALTKGRRQAAQNAARLIAKTMNQDARIASASVGGWDTHIGQKNKINRPLEQLATFVQTLRTDMAANWEKTAVVAVSEFGRTARENGTGGTDHGYGGLLILAGGALKGGIGGQVAKSKWPGLGQSDLYEGRDLKPTDDVRRYLAWLLAGLFPIGNSDIERTVFPGLDLGDRIDIV